MKKIISLLLLAVIMLSASFAYAGSFEITAEIPVSCAYLGGSFALYDGEKEIDRVQIKSGGSGKLSVTLNTLDYFSYKVRQADMDNASVDYDETEYDVQIVTILDEEERPSYCLTVNEGRNGKKVDAIVFKNYTNDIPQTGDTNSMLLWGCIAATSVIAIFVVLKFRKEDKAEDGKDA